MTMIVTDKHLIVTDTDWMDGWMDGRTDGRTDGRERSTDLIAFQESVSESEAFPLVNSSSLRYGNIFP